MFMTESAAAAENSTGNRPDDPGNPYGMDPGDGGPAEACPVRWQGGIPQDAQADGQGTGRVWSGQARMYGELPQPEKQLAGTTGLIRGKEREALQEKMTGIQQETDRRIPVF